MKQSPDRTFGIHETPDEEGLAGSEEPPAVDAVSPGDDRTPREADGPSLPSDSGPRRHGPLAGLGLLPRATRWTLGLLALLLVAGVAGGGYQTYVNYNAAQHWEMRASANAEQRDTARAELEETQAKLRRSRTALRDSEADVRQLEERVGQLANEKARVEDERQAVLLTAAAYAQLLDQIHETSEMIQTCLDYMVELDQRSTAAWNLMMAGGYPDVDAVNALQSSTYDYCDTARDYHAETVSRVEQLQ